jgi:hypothetical protein
VTSYQFSALNGVWQTCSYTGHNSTWPLLACDWGARVRDILSDIDGRNISAFDLATRIDELQLAELRALGRVLLTRAGQDIDATQTNEYITVVQEAVRRSLQIEPNRPSPMPASTSGRNT